MKQFNKPDENMGGLLKIWAIPPSVITITGNTVQFSSTEDIIEMYCSPGSMSFTEKQLRENAGTAFQTELKSFLPKDSPEATRLINEMINRRWIVVYKDQNEQFKMAGRIQIPLRVAFDLDTGSDTPERNGHSVSFFGKQTNKAVFIDNPFE